MMPGGGNGAVYEHGIATYALGEAYTMTRMAKIAPVLEKASQVIIRGQTPPGGWMYGYRGDHTDGSVTGWQIQALKSVHLSGLKVKGLEECLDKAIENIKKLQSSNGGFPYRAGQKGGWNLAGVGVLGLQMWKNASSKEVRRGVEFIVENQKDLDYDGKAPLYSWYYNTYACFMRGGSDWRKWNRMFRNELLKHQKPDGSWKPEGGGQSDKQAGPDGEVYRTCLCTLMLEVYYRFLPTT
jgi:hypothetical protein